MYLDNYIQEYIFCLFGFVFVFLRKRAAPDMILKQLHNQISTRVASPFAKTVVL